MDKTQENVLFFYIFASKKKDIIRYGKTSI
jgi:hypothetical protein